MNVTVNPDFLSHLGGGRATRRPELSRWDRRPRTTEWRLGQSHEDTTIKTILHYTTHFRIQLRISLHLGFT
jgi:hypothetical protein